MKKIFYCFILFVFNFQNLEAQNNRKSLFIFEIGSIVGVSSNSVINQDFNAFRVKFSGYKNVNEKLSLGISIGTDNYRERGNKNFKTFYNTLPANLTGIYFLNSKRENFFADANLGYALPIFDNFEKGLNLGMGGGYLMGLGKKTKLSLKTGYNFQKIDDVQFISNKSSDLNIGSIRITLGFVF
jgi:hypothetical protein